MDHIGIVLQVKTGIAKKKRVLENQMKHWILLVVIGKYRVPPGIVPLCRAASQPSRLRH